MIRKHTSKDGTVSFYVRVGNSPLTTFSEKDYRTRTDARHAARQYELDLKRGKSFSSVPTVAEYIDRCLDHWTNEAMRNGRKRKSSSIHVMRQSLKPLREKFGDIPLDAVTREAARDAALGWSVNATKTACQLYNRAADEFEGFDRNPFRSLAPTSTGRAEDKPPTPEQFEALIEACSVLDKKLGPDETPYAPVMQAFLRFAGHTGMRPGELYVLEWTDIDFDRRRINVARRLWNGTVDLPKTQVEAKEIVLTPEARDAILPLQRVSPYVFHNKSGGRLSQPTMSGYWGQVKAKAGIDMDLYFVTKHFCCHRWYVVDGKSPLAIAGQMRWSRSAVEKLLRTYGHGDVGWEREFDPQENVRELRVVNDG